MEVAGVRMCVCPSGRRVLTVNVLFASLFSIRADGDNDGDGGDYKATVSEVRVSHRTSGWSGLLLSGCKHLFTVFCCFFFIRCLLLSLMNVFISGVYPSLTR